MGLKTEELQAHLKKVSKGCETMALFEPVLERWIKAQPNLIEQRFMEVLGYLGYQNHSSVVHVPTTQGVKAVRINKGQSPELDISLLEWDKIQTEFDKNGKSILDRFKKALLDSKGKEDGDEVAGQVVLVNPQPQKTHIRHFCKVIGVQRSDFIENSLKQLEADVKRHESGTGYGVGPLGNTLIGWRKNVEFDSRQRIEKMEFFIEKFVTPKHYPLLTVVTIIGENGKSTELGESKYTVKVKDVEMSGMDDVIAAFVGNVATLQ
jgi:hypothetical protein